MRSYHHKAGLEHIGTVLSVIVFWRLSASMFLALCLVSATMFVYVHDMAFAQSFVRDWGSEGDSGNSQFQLPFGVTVDAGTGNIYALDTVNNRVQKFTNIGEFIRAWGTACMLSTGQGCIDEDGPGLLLSGINQFLFPFGITVNPSDGNVFVADTYNHRIQQFTSTGQFVRQWGSFGTGAGQFQYPFGISVNPSNGNVFVADTGNNRIEQFTVTGQFVRLWGTFGTGPGQFQYPFGIATNHVTDTVYVADTYNQRIEQFTSTGQFVKQWGSFGTGSGMFQYPFGIAINSIDGTAIIADTGNNRIQVFSICNIIC